VFHAMRCNRWEREMWFHWRPLFKWRTLCPIHFADPLGVLVVMPKAIQPVADSAVKALPDYYPGVTAELKSDDYGYVGGQLVALDYGLPYADSVRERRTYYQGFNGREAVHPGSDA
jgi:hypothetical protein